jgi:prepilin-type N-terminal cleavage/methylation domain-containing protein
LPVKRLEDASGYSLVEVMAAIVILSVAIIPMVGMLDAGLNATRSAGNYDKARMLANNRLEKVQALPYNRPGGASDSAVEIYHPSTPVPGTSGTFAYTVTTQYWRESGGNLEAVADTSIVRPMMRITVTVTWDGSHSYTTRGFVASGTGS